MFNQVGFEYLGSGKETAFETFLRYCDEKEKSSVVLGSILQNLLISNSSLLDVGAGNGDYLRLSLEKLTTHVRLDLTMIEPSQSLIKKLEAMTGRFLIDHGVRVLCERFEEVELDQQYDIVLASHLPFPKEKLSEIYSKMISLLKPTGRLIVVLREKDDAHEFRTRFKPVLEGEGYQSLTLDDALEVLNGLSSGAVFQVSAYSAPSVLTIPLRDNKKDEITLIEFFLNQKWREIPKYVRKDILEYIERKDGIFRLVDGFAIVSRSDS